MKALPQKIRKRGSEYNLIIRTSDHAIYSRKMDKGGFYFEVFEIQKNKEWICHGNTIPAKEGIPSESQWGSKGWTYMTKEAAFEKFNSLIRN